MSGGADSPRPETQKSRRAPRSQRVPRSRRRRRPWNGEGGAPSAAAPRTTSCSRGAPSTWPTPQGEVAKTPARAGRRPPGRRPSGQGASRRPSWPGRDKVSFRSGRRPGPFERGHAAQTRESGTLELRIEIRARWRAGGSRARWCCVEEGKRSVATRVFAKSRAQTPTPKPTKDSIPTRATLATRSVARLSTYRAPTASRSWAMLTLKLESAMRCCC